MTAVRNVMSALVMAGLASGTFACSSSDDNGGVKSNDAGSTSSALSAAFGAKCARCHGSGGLGMGIYPKLPGGKTDADTFVAFVRAGKDAMPAFTSADISDADLRSDFAYLSGK